MWSVYRLSDVLSIVGTEETGFAGKRLGKHVRAAKNIHARTEELYDAVFSVRSASYHIFNRQWIPRSRKWGRLNFWLGITWNGWGILIANYNLWRKLELCLRHWILNLFLLKSIVLHCVCLQSFRTKQKISFLIFSLGRKMRGLLIFGPIRHFKILLPSLDFRWWYPEYVINLQLWNISILHHPAFFSWLYISNFRTQHASDSVRLCNYLLINNNNIHKANSVAWVHEGTIPTERPPLVGEVNANFCG
jgi:hypothetical protein